MIEAEHMVKIIAIEGFPLTFFRWKTLFKVFNGFSALERLYGPDELKILFCSLF
jgi:hypothetical protein